MYEQHFGFREPPFRITPDPRFLYRNPAVEEAAAALAYGIERRKGFCSLVGEAGTGKTTLLRFVLDTLSGNIRTVLLLHPTVEFDEILEYVLTELGIPIDGGRKLVLLQRLNEFLLEHTRAGGNVALVIDEAQDLATAVLEELRLLSNLETGTEKILQIVLAGQPELETKLADTSLRQLRQRIALHVRLRPLSPDEVSAYIACRLEHAGATRRDIFTPDAIARIGAVSQGIPRIINVLADACLVTAYATETRSVTAPIVDEAWVDYARLAVVDAMPIGLVAPVLPRPQPPLAPPVAPVAAAIPPSTPVAEPTQSEPPPPPSPPAPEPTRPVQAATPVLAEQPIEPEREPIDLVPDPAEWPRRLPPRTAVMAFVVVLVGIATMHVLRMFPESPTPPAHTPVAAPTPAPLAAPVAAAPPVAAASGDVPSAAEARAVVHQFILAYEARDVGQLMALFAPEATANDRQGADAIRDDYARTFARLVDATCTVPRVELASWGDRMAVTGPMVIGYRQRTGESGEVRGRAEWEIMRRGGTPRIVALRYARDAS